jgi:hypothetical protein
MRLAGHVAGMGKKGNRNRAMVVKLEIEVVFRGQRHR